MKASLEYYGKLPGTRQKELRKMFRLYLMMCEQNALYSEFVRLFKYSRFVAMPACRGYTTVHWEYRIDHLLKKYYRRTRKDISAEVLANWIAFLRDPANFLEGGQNE